MTIDILLIRYILLEVGKKSRDREFFPIMKGILRLQIHRFCIFDFMNEKVGA